jgi:glycogen debranching enzyme
MAAAAQQAVELRVSRFVGNGMHEDLDIINYSDRTVRLRLAVELDADFADQARRLEKVEGLKIRRLWRPINDRPALTIEAKARRYYVNQDESGIASFARGITVAVANSSSEPVRTLSGISFSITIPPRQTWHCCLDICPWLQNEMHIPDYGCNSFLRTAGGTGAQQQQLLEAATKIRTGEKTITNAGIQRTIEQAVLDMISLRLEDLDTASGWTVAAGLPVYMGLFGRDSLTAAWQFAIVTPRVLFGSLERVADLQGKQTVNWRDEEPGRMIHEARTGTLAVLNYDIRARSYCSVTTSGFYPVALSELWHWTADKEFVGRFIDAALDGLKYLDERAPHSEHGFYQYKTKSKDGVTNQAWKDSDDAIVRHDGTIVSPPIATCEEQGFVYCAKLLMSELLWWFDRKDEAKRLFH